jgi:protein SCO1/2
MNTALRFQCLAAICLVLGLVACRATKPVAGPARSAGEQVFQVRGVVKEVRAPDKEVVIKHEAIPGYMAAMTMPFDVKDAKELDGLGPGDQIAFRMTVTDTDGWIDQIRVLQKGVPEDPKPAVASTRAVRQVEELNVGDLMPDYPFTTESRRAIKLGDFRGQALGFTFIYTRCPYPTFCPRQNRQFAEACAELKQRLPGPDKRWQLLSISFDPAFDTPAVLSRYAKQFDFDAAWWSFCTGDMVEIDAITEQFGMFFARDGESFSHNVRTVVVDKAGRIQRIFVGNDWKTADFVAEMVKAAGGS